MRPPFAAAPVHAAASPLTHAGVKRVAGDAARKMSAYIRADAAGARLTSVPSPSASCRTFQPRPRHPSAAVRIRRVADRLRRRSPPPHTRRILVKKYAMSPRRAATACGVALDAARMKAWMRRPRAAVDVGGPRRAGVAALPSAEVGESATTATRRRQTPIPARARRARAGVGVSGDAVGVGSTEQVQPAALSGPPFAPAVRWRRRAAVAPHR